MQYKHASFLLLSVERFDHLPVHCRLAGAGLSLLGKSLAVLFISQIIFVEKVWGGGHIQWYMAMETTYISFLVWR